MKFYNKDEIIGITAGSFDLCHTGHLLMFAEAKTVCDKLIVCLQTDPTIDRPSKTKPVETTFERYMRLTSCALVDHIIPYDTEADFLKILQHVDYDYRFLDETYRGREFTGHDLKPEKHYFNSRRHDLSSTELRGRLLSRRTSPPDAS